MKRTLLVMSLAAVLVLAFAGSALAYIAPPTYIAWDGAGVNSNGPHADYQTSTTKCAVCHSVHAAPGVGYVAGSSNGPDVYTPWTATGPNTQLLLRSSVADSCKFCHVDTAIGGVQLYGGAAGVYGTWIGPGHTGQNSSACVNCHAVHGANTYKGANTSKILRLLASGNRAPQAEVLGGSGATAGLFDTQASATNSNLKYEQQTVFCSECHKNFSRSSDTTIAVSGRKSHSMVSAPSSTFTNATGGPATQYDAAGAVLSAVQTVNTGATFAGGTAIASAASSSCRACHTAGGVDQAGVTWNSFPHYTRGLPYFLSGGAAPITDAVGNNSGTPLDTAVDGNCKTCHASVGVTF